MTSVMSPYENAASERGIIATVLHEPEAIHDASAAGITADSFRDPHNSKVYQAMIDLARDHKPITRYHLCITLPDNSGTMPLAIYEDAGGSKAFLASFIRDVQSCEMARKLKLAAQETLAQLERGDAPAQVMSAAQASMAESGASGIKVRTLRDIRPEKVAEWKAAQGLGYVDLPTLWPELDKILGGHRRKMVNVLGGYRGEGKSSLARQMLTALALRGVPVGLISMEDPDGVAGSGIAGNLCNFSVYHMDTGTSHESPEEVDAKWQGVESLPLYIADQPQTITGVLNTMRLFTARYGVQMIAVDHIQYIMPGSGRHESRNEEIRRYSGAISGATKTLGIHTLVLSQLSRECEKESRKPRLSDLRDSGSIEQDARAVMLLYRDEDQMHRLEVAKNNNGPRGTLRIERIDGRQRFECRGQV